MIPYERFRAKQELDWILNEYFLARQKHPPANSLHEGYAVLLEEVDEFWGEVKKKSGERDMRNVRTELQQIAAMALAILAELTPDPTDPQEILE